MLAKARGSPRHPCQVRCFLDLSSTGSQLRFLQNSLRPARAALGFIELAELQSVADGSGPAGWTVGIWVPKLERPLAVPAEARYLKPMPGGVRIGFEFMLKEASRDELDAQPEVRRPELPVRGGRELVAVEPAQMLLRALVLVVVGLELALVAAQTSTDPSLYK